MQHSLSARPITRSFINGWLDLDKTAPDAWITHEKNALVAWERVASKVNLTLEAEGRADCVATLPAGAALVDLVERILKDEVKGSSAQNPFRWPDPMPMLWPDP